MRDNISRRKGLQPYQRLYVEGLFFLINPAAKILLLAAEPTAVPGFERLSVLPTPSGCVRVVCFGSAAALLFGFFGFGAWPASGSSSSASPAWNARTCTSQPDQHHFGVFDQLCHHNWTHRFPTIVRIAFRRIISVSSASKKLKGILRMFVGGAQHFENLSTGLNVQDIYFSRLRKPDLHQGRCQSCTQAAKVQ